MLSKLIITLENEKPVHWNMGSLMQGVIMEKISPQYAEELHSGNLNPYSQYIYSVDNNSKWVISALNKTADRELVRKLIEQEYQQIHLLYCDETLKVSGYEYSHISLEELMQTTYFGECSRFLTISFDTPTAFKTQGRYQFYPTVFHVFQSLVMKYDAMVTDNQVYSDEIMAQIQEYIEIKNYSLKSSVFSLEGTKIPSFRGTIQLKIKGPQLFCNLIHLLAKFGEYSGVGIKTAMGMGAMHIVQKGENY